MKVLILSPRTYPINFNPESNNFMDHSRATDLATQIPHHNQITILINGEIPPKIMFLKKNISIRTTKRQFTRSNKIVTFILKKMGMATTDFNSSLYSFLPIFLSDTKKYIDKNNIILICTSTALFPSLYAKYKSKYLITDPFGSFFQLSLRNIYYTKWYMIPFWLFRLALAYLIESLNFALSDKILVFNKKHKQYFQKIYPFINHKKYEYLPIYIRTNLIRSDIDKIQKYRQKYQIKEKDFVVLFVGNFTIPQNLAPLNDLINKSDFKKYKRIKFLIVGNIPQNIKRNNNFIYTGFITDLENIISFSNLCLAPTLQGSGIKTKILLYLLQNKPIITTKQGLNFLEKNNNIYICNQKQIKKKIIELLKKTNKKHYNSRSFVIQNYSRKAFTKKFNLLINNLPSRFVNNNFHIVHFSSH